MNEDEIDMEKVAQAATDHALKYDPEDKEPASAERDSQWNACIAKIIRSPWEPHRALFELKLNKEAS